MAQFTGNPTGEGLARVDRRGNMSATDKRRLDSFLDGATRLATALLDGLMSAGDKALVNQLGTDSGWQGLSYAANWSDFGAGFPAGAYKIDELGVVNLKGLVKKSSAIALPDTIATLPVGARPATTHCFTYAYSGGVGEIRVNPSGAIFLQSGGSTTNNSLDGIRFDPAT